MTNFKGENVNDCWEEIKSTLLSACDKNCGWTKSTPRRKETWWWDDTVSNAIKLKRKLWKEWKKGTKSKEEYLVAKRSAKSAVYFAKKSANEKKFGDLNSTEKRNTIFKMTRKMKEDNKDIIGEKCVKDQEGNMAFDDCSKAKAWESHYSNLLNVEFPWNDENLPNELAVHGPPILITKDMICKAISQMKKGKAAGPSGVVLEMIISSKEHIAPHLTKLANCIIFKEKIPEDWNMSHIINCFKGKGDPLVMGNYRGLKLLEHVIKILERVIESIIRSRVNINKMQYRFMPDRGTMDAIFILRQMHEKHLEKHKPLYFAFVDLEKAFDRVPRKVIWWAMRKLGIEEWIIRLVQAMYADATSSVRINNTFSKKFGVKVGVHQGSVSSPLLFVIVMEALSQDCRHSCPWELLYADDLVIMNESLEGLVKQFTA